MRRHPIFARCYEWLSQAGERVLGRYREEVAGGAVGLTLEIGAGNGLNFERYPAGARVVALEPEPGMLRAARRRAAEAAASIRLVAGDAQRLPFPDDAFDTVTATLVLCSVADPAAAAREMRRVLRAGGEVRVFEHVRGGRRLARWQDRLEGPWGFFGGGCHPNRDTVRTLREAGFALEVKAVDVPGLPLVRPHVVAMGRAP